MPDKKKESLKYNHAASVSKSKTKMCICPQRKLLRRGMTARNINNAIRIDFRFVMAESRAAIASKKLRFTTSHQRFACKGGREDKGRTTSADGRVEGMKLTSG